MGWICTRCIRIEHDAGKSMVTVPEEGLGKCSYCGVENWVFEVVGDVPAKTIADMPELEVEKPKKKKKAKREETIELIDKTLEGMAKDVEREVSESIPPLEEASQEKDVITSPSSEGEEESIPEPEIVKVDNVFEAIEVAVDARFSGQSVKVVKDEPVEKSLDDMTEDELRAKLAEMEKK